MQRFKKNHILILLLLMFFVFASGGCGGDSNFVDNNSTLDSGNSAAEIPTTQLSDLFAADALQKMATLPLLGEKEVKVRDPRSLPVNYGKQLTFENMTASITGRAVPNFRRIQDLPEEQAVNVQGNVASQSIDVLSKRGPILNLGRIKIPYQANPNVLARPSPTDYQKEAFMSSMEADASYVVIQDTFHALGEISLYQAYTGIELTITLTNYSNLEAILIRGVAIEGMPTGMQVSVESIPPRDPAQYPWILPAQGEANFKIYITPVNQNLIRPETVITKLTWIPILEQTGAEGSSWLMYDLVESTFKVDALERGALAFESEKANLLGDVTDNVYKTDSGTNLTEAHVAQIPLRPFSKSGLAIDGNTRLLLRFQTKIPDSGFLFRFSYFYNQGFRLERLDKSLITNNDDYGYLPTVDIGDGVYQATAVLVPPEDWKYHLGWLWPENDFYYDIFQVRPEGNSFDDYLVYDIQRKMLWAVPTPIVAVHGLWGDSGTFGKIDDFRTTGEHSTWSYLNAAYTPNRAYHPSEYTYDGTSGFEDWNTPQQVGRFANHLRSVFQEMNEWGLASTRVDILAHSMGGLYTWNYISNNPNYYSTDSYKNGSIRRFITVATPYTGSNWANYIQGKYQFFHGEPTNNATRWVLNNRNYLLDSIQLSQTAYGGAHFLKFSPSLHYDPNNVIGALETLGEGSEQLRILHDDQVTSKPNTPMYAMSGSSHANLRAQLRRPPQEFFNLFESLRKAQQLGYLQDLPTTLGEVPLEFSEFYNTLFIGEVLSAAVGKYGQTLQLAYYLALSKHLPKNITVNDAVQILEVMFGEDVENDLMVGEYSSKWAFENQYWRAITTGGLMGTQHVGVAKNLETGYKTWLLLGSVCKITSAI